VLPRMGNVVGTKPQKANLLFETEGAREARIARAVTLVRKQLNGTRGKRHTECWITKVGESHPGGETGIVSRMLPVRRSEVT
jgi:hypothetical protein